MAGYATSSMEEKESGPGFEFTRRKKWPQILLQEMTGAALICLKPFQPGQNSMDAAGRSNNSLGWRIVYISPSGGDMIGQKPTDLENRDFLNLVYPADQPLLQSFFTSLLSPASGETSSVSSSTSSAGPTGTVGSGRSQTTYARVHCTDGSGDMSRSGPIGWEFRAHASGLDGLPSGFAGAGGYRLDGTVIPRSSTDEGALKGKAVWVMGRRIGAGPIEETSQSLDAFLELKLENEKLREELRELQHEIDDEDYQATRSYMNPITLDAPTPSSSSPTPSSPSASSSASEPRREKQKKKPLKGPKDLKDPRDKKRPKKASGSSGAAGPGGAGAGPGTAGGSGAGLKEAGEGLHVCVTCGRTDSPEWRKGPLGPKTLCNACGLRWAKRNSTQPSRKEKKAAEAATAKR